MAVLSSLKDFIDEVPNHAVFQNKYFQFLKSHLFTPRLFDIHRANFFFRTEATVKSLAHICANAAAHDDSDTLILFSYILNEECGEGNKFRCHELLMEQSHNIYGEKEFQLKPLKVKEARLHYPHGLIIQSTKAYREKMTMLLNQSYETMLGVAFALETHASFMLTNLREIFSLNRKRMSKTDYKNNVEIYFNVHLDDGIEDRHSEDTKYCVLNNCQSAKALSDIMYGINETLKIQKQMWDGMYAEAVLDNTLC